MSTPAPSMPPKIDPAEVIADVTWIARNLPTLGRWGAYILRALKAAWSPSTPARLLLVWVLAMQHVACAGAKIATGITAVIAAVSAARATIGEIPPPPDGQGPVATPSPTRTPVSSATPTPEPPTPTPTPPCRRTVPDDNGQSVIVCPPDPTATPTATPRATSTPVPTMTPAPPPPPPTSCLDLSTVPEAAVPVFTGKPCRPAAGFVAVHDKTTDTDGCVRDWRCHDGDEHNPGHMIGYSLANGGPAGVHRCDVGEGFGPQYVCDAGRPGQEAYGRNIRDDGSIIHVGADDEFQDWRRAGICAPVVCSATPTPSPAPTASPVATPEIPAGRACHLPPGTGDGADCPRTAQRLLIDVDSALSRVLEHHAELFTDDGARVKDGQVAAYYTALAGEVRAGGLCAFVDGGNELAVKNSNDFSEQYATLSSDGRVRRGDNSYRATCTPAWSAIPATPVADADVPPLLVLWRVGDSCHNPQDGPKFIDGHRCIVGSTAWFRDPAHPEDASHDSPCDQEHDGWSTFCHGKPWGDPRGPQRSVEGAAAWGLADDNPFHTDVTFIPGVPFTVCTQPYSDVHDERGISIPVLGDAKQCKEQVH